MKYEYKCVGAPERPKRKRGAKSRTDRVASAMEELIDVHAVNGWEYMRTDLVPVEEKASIFSRTQEVHRAVMVFRRALEGPGARDPLDARSEQRGAETIRLAAEPEHGRRPRRPPTGLS